MNFEFPQRLGRILVVLALIVALLGSRIPMPARAVGFVPGLYDIAANIGVNAALRAIGVGPGNSPDAFNQLVTDVTNNLFEGLSPLTQVFLDYTQNGFRAFLSADFLSRVLSFLFRSGTLSVSPLPISSTYHLPSFSISDYTLSSPVSFVSFERPISDAPSDYRYFYYYFISRDFFQVSATNTAKYLDGMYYMNVGSKTYWIHDTSTDFNYWATLDGASFLGSYAPGASPLGDLSVFDGSVVAAGDVALDSVSDSLSGSSYADWTAGAITQENQPFVPVSIPSISDSAAIFTQTQAQAQAGTIPETVVDEIVSGAEVVPDTGTIADVITAVRALSADIVAAVQAIPAAIADVFSPPAISEEYMISLSDFFPFCLPFDIYDLLSALAADPQAPVFEWTIAVPRWGISHDIEIDLSEWDDIARLFRTFELGAFVLGLALITRQKFLRS